MFLLNIIENTQSLFCFFICLQFMYSHGSSS